MQKNSSLQFKSGETREDIMTTKVQRIIASQRSLQSSKKSVLALRLLQIELRTAFNETMRVDGLTYLDVQKRTGLRAFKVKQFALGNEVLSSGDYLIKSCQFAQRKHLESKISEIEKTIRVHYIALTLFDEQVIETVFMILDAHTAHTLGYCNGDEFARLFGSHAETVGYIIRGSRDGYITLQENKIAHKAVLDVLNDPQFAQRVAELKKNVQHAREEISLTLQHIDSILAERYVSMTERAKFIGVPKTSYSMALRAISPVEVIQEIVGKAQQALSTREAEHTIQLPDESQTTIAVEPLSEVTKIISDTKPKKPSRAKSRGTHRVIHKVKQESVSQKPKDTCIPLEELAGPTSPRGVHLVLTQSGFMQLDYEPDSAFVNGLIQQLEITRGLLNVCMQIKNPRTRAKIQKQVSAEVEAMYVALQSFTSEYPNRLVEAYKTLTALRG